MSLALFAHHGDDTLTWFLTVFEGSRSVQKEYCLACRDGHVFDASTSGSRKWFYNCFLTQLQGTRARNMQ